MLEMRPNCECCNKDLAPYEESALICSFECTFCLVCASDKLKGKCPNCGGTLVPRPPRTREKLLKYPGSDKRIYKSAGCSN